MTTSRVSTMRAVVQDRYGPVDVLRVEDRPLPRPAAGEVVVQVHAAGVDRGAWHLMTGLPYLVRPVLGVRAPKEPVRGREMAGRVVDVGEGVEAFRVGDEVYGIGEGCFAEHARARVDRIAPAPGVLTPVRAAAVPISGLTALQAVRDHGRVRAGQSVLVIGASGGVGSFAVQIAKAAGAEVTAVCSAAKADFVRSLGADRVVAHDREQDVSGGRRHDVVLDCGGGRPLRALRRMLAPRGTLVIVGGEGGGRWLGGVDRQARAMVLSPFVRQRLVVFVSQEKAEDLRALTELLESGAVVPAVDRVFPLAETAAAIAHLEQGRVRGKVVVEVGSAG